MKLLFLGTGADDWYNYIGEDKRKNSGAIINGELLIDFSPATIAYPKALRKVKNIIITHTHRDHYNAELLKAFCKNRQINVYAEKVSAKKISDQTGISVIPLSLGDEYEIGGYTIIPLAANHSVEDKNETPLNYIINDGKASLYWGCDSGWLVNSAWHIIKAQKLDAAVFDCTIWDEAGDYRVFEHNNISMVKSLRETFLRNKILKENGASIATHFSMNAQYKGKKLEDILSESGIIAAYDGMECEL